MAFFFSHARLIEDTVSKYISLKCSFDHKTALFKANVANKLKLNCMMAPCKRQLKATRHLICGSCSNWWTSSSLGARSPGLKSRQIVLVLSVGDVRR